MGLLCLCFTLPGLAIGVGDVPRRIPVSGLAATPVPVASWDSDSPQQLVRIDGVLYQQDSGFYYPVIDDRITVRLVDGVEDWAALVSRAVGSRPQTFGDLEALVPVRRNRLGIVDVAIPDGDPTRWCELVFASGLVKYAEVSTIGVYTATPNDPLYPQQWALNNTGQTGGTPGADIKAEAAWDITSGTASIQVAVLDSGTSVDHVDLAANVWHNEGEIPDERPGRRQQWIRRRLGGLGLRKRQQRSALEQLSRHPRHRDHQRRLGNNSIGHRRSGRRSGRAGCARDGRGRRRERTPIRSASWTTR